MSTGTAQAYAQAVHTIAAAEGLFFQSNVSKC